MSVNQLLLEAIALNKCVVATYNNVTMTLAPHILYSKHDALFIDAVALEKNGEPPREKKLGAFNLAGLKGLALAERHFQNEPVFDPNAPKYEGNTLFAVGAE
ncbi:MAG: hypothetical protein ABI668_04585 [Sphingorhabdus sp.]